MYFFIIFYVNHRQICTYNIVIAYNIVDSRWNLSIQVGSNTFSKNSVFDEYSSSFSEQNNKHCEFVDG